MHLEEEKKHQAKIARAFLKEHKDKYLKGAIEHSSNGLLEEIPPRQLVEFAIEEVLDLASYLYTLRDAIEFQEEN
jgi:hypothetical protein